MVRLKKIEFALQACVPNMRHLKFNRDDNTDAKYL